MDRVCTHVWFFFLFLKQLFKTMYRLIVHKLKNTERLKDSSQTIQLGNNHWEHFGAFYLCLLILPLQQLFEVGPLITIAQRWEAEAQRGELTQRAKLGREGPRSQSSEQASSMHRHSAHPILQPAALNTSSALWFASPERSRQDFTASWVLEWREQARN